MIRGSRIARLSSLTRSDTIGRTGWQDQGRRYHQWFGHGTAGNDLLAGRPFTQADLVAQAVAEMPRFLPPSMRNAYNLEAGQRFNGDLTDAIQVRAASAGLDPAGFRKHLA